MTAKDGESGAVMGASELPLVLTAALAVGEAAVRVRGGEAGEALSKRLTFPQALAQPLVLGPGATAEARSPFAA